MFIGEYQASIDDKGRIKPIYLGMGIGVYWLYPTITVPCRPGVAKPQERGLSGKMRFSGTSPQGSIGYYLQSTNQDYLETPYDEPLPPKHNSMLGRLYRDYGTPTNQTIHFSNRRGSPTADQRYMLALQRPSLDITKPTLHFPGCRFPRIGALETDFTHTIYTARPWDYSPCGPLNICGRTDPDYLNYTKTIDTVENEQLVFDAKQYTIKGNGLPPDIPSLGDHTIGTGSVVVATDVIHKVYMKDAAANPAVVLDGVCDYDSSVNQDETIEIQDPLFSSHNSCFTDPSIYVDFADGYSCVRGYQPYIPPDIGNGEYADLLINLGLSPVGVTGAPSNVLFFLGSGIRAQNEKAFRLDAGCLLVNCNPTNSLEPLCSISSYLDQDGQYDWEPDHLDLELRLLEIEQVNTDVILLDGTITSLMEMV
jgi:hypothetical protein